VILIDVNVLVYAHREDAPDHSRYRQWLTDLINGDTAYGVADLVLSGFLRVVTHPRVFRAPSPLESALAFVSEIRDRPHRVTVAPGECHWDIFTGLCRAGSAVGNSLPMATWPLSPSNPGRSGSRPTGTTPDFPPALAPPSDLMQCRRLAGPPARSIGSSWTARTR
jgi:hypothetical protein